MATRLSPPKPEVVLPELHASNGRLDAAKVAEFLDVPLSKLAAALGRSYPSVHKTPAAEALQAPLRPIKRSLELLSSVLDGPKAVKIWLRTPHPDLGNLEPLQLMLDGKADRVETLLANALDGIPA
jgi:hypothetical protein